MQERRRTSSQLSATVCAIVEKAGSDSQETQHVTFLVAFPWWWGRTQRALLEIQVLLRVILNTEIICQIL